MKLTEIYGVTRLIKGDATKGFIRPTLGQLFRSYMLYEQKLKSGEQSELPPTYFGGLRDFTANTLYPTGGGGFNGMLVFNNDGTKFYNYGYNSDIIYESNLSTPWDITTAYTNFKGLILPVGLNTTYGLCFKPDGTKAFVTIDEVLLSYTLSTPWAMATATKDTQEGSTSNLWTESPSISSMVFTADGLTLICLCKRSDKVYEVNLSIPWDVSTISYTPGNELDTSIQDNSPTTMAMSSDGYQLYFYGLTNDSLFSYSLTSPWDIKTGTHSKTKSLLTESTGMGGIAFNSTGTRLLVADRASSLVPCHQYTLGTPWDINSLSYDNVSQDIGGDDYLNDLLFNANGTKAYFLADHNNNIRQVTLSTPWDLDTITHTFGDQLELSSFDTSPKTMFMNSTGTKLFVSGTQNHNLLQFTMSIPWDVTSAVYDSVSIYFGDVDQSITDIYFSPDGTKLFATGSSKSLLVYCDLLTPWELSSATALQSEYVLIGNLSTYQTQFSADGTQLFVLGARPIGIVRYSLSTPFDIDSAKWVRGYFEPIESVSSKDMVISVDGTRLYLLSTSTDSIYQYSFGIPWDIETLSYTSKSFLYSNEDDNAKGFAINSTGTKLHLIGETTGTIYEYNLGVAWDVSSAVLANSLLVTDRDARFAGIDFNSTGTLMWFGGYTKREIYQYSLTTPWDIATTSYTDDKILTSYGEYSKDFAFNATGTMVYLINYSDHRCHQYSLSSPYDVSTMVHVQRSITLDEDRYNLGIEFNPSGSKMYMFGNDHDYLYQYSLSTPWDITTLSYDSVSLYVKVEEPYGQTFCFKPDGLSVYIAGHQLYRYDLTIPWDISSGSYASDTFDDTNFSAKATWGITFNSSGTILYTVIGEEYKIGQYDLSIPWVLSSAVYSKTLEVGYPVAGYYLRGIEFSNSGTKLTVIQRDNLVQYDLSTPWDTASAVKSSDTAVPTFGVASLYNIGILPDGSALTIVGSTAVLNMITLDTDYDITSIDYSSVKELSVKKGSYGPQALAFNDDGSSMLLVSTNPTKVLLEYVLTTPWDASTLTLPNGAGVLNFTVLSNTGLTFNLLDDNTFILGGARYGQIQKYIKSE